MNMNKFLKYFLFSLIILFLSCKQNSKNDSLELNNDSSEIIDINYTVPIILSQEFKDENKISEWSNYNVVELNILVLANSISGFIKNEEEDET